MGKNNRLKRKISKKEEKEQKPEIVTPSKEQPAVVQKKQPEPHVEQAKQAKIPVQATATPAKSLFPQVVKAKRIEDEEREEFEVVENARPAVCNNKRKSKLRWKHEENKSGSDKEAADRAAEESKKEESPVTPPSSQNESNVDPLKDAVAELTLEKQQLKETVDRLKKRLKNRDTKIEKLKKALEEKKKTKEQSKSETEVQKVKIGDKEFTAEQLRQELTKAKEVLQKQKQQTMADKEEIMKLSKELRTKPRLRKSKQSKNEKDPKQRPQERKEKKEINEATQAVATKILEILRRNQLLENAINHKETQELHAFFVTGGNTHPNENILMLLDKAISSGIDKLINSPHTLDDVIDNQMRQFLVKSSTAKGILLETMLSKPEFLPSVWGGKMAVLNKKAEKEKKDNKQNEKKGETVEKTAKATEKTAQSTMENPKFMKSVYMLPK